VTILAIDNLEAGYRLRPLGTCSLIIADSTDYCLDFVERVRKYLSISFAESIEFLNEAWLTKARAGSPISKFQSAVHTARIFELFDDVRADQTAG
jgi:hypothetical protein